MLGWSRNVLVAYLTLLLAASAIHASNGFQSARRDHVNLKRMVRKRDAPALVPVIGAGQDPAENPPITTTTPVASVTTSDATTTPSSSASVSASSTDASGTPGLINSLLSDLVPSSTSSSTNTSSIPSSTSSTSSVSSTVSTTSSSTSTQEAPTTPPPPPPAAAPTSTSSHGRSTSTIVKTAEQEAETSVPKPTGAAATKSKTLEVIIIIASSVGGIAILWTVFRKWKLGRSSKFNERLQPIDWQRPNGDNTNSNEVMPGVRRAASSASSFHSASVQSHHGDAPNLHPIPEHDFTAGVVPVGGYADLARGPSPPMGQVHGGVALGRGYEYDHGVPLHHQAGGAYGAYDYQGAPRY